MNYLVLFGLIFIGFAFLFSIGKTDFYVLNILGTTLLDIYAIFYLHNWIIITVESIILISLTYQFGYHYGNKQTRTTSKKL